MFVSKNATFLDEDHIREHIPRSKVVWNELSNETTETSTRVGEEVGTLTKGLDGASSNRTHPPQELRESRRSERVVNPPI